MRLPPCFWYERAECECVLQLAGTKREKEMRELLVCVYLAYLEIGGNCENHPQTSAMMSSRQALQCVYLSVCRSACHQEAASGLEILETRLRE